MNLGYFLIRIVHPMKILAIEKENPSTNSEQFTPYLKDEAKKVWEFYQSDFIREIYFRQDHSTAVLILECESIEKAKNQLIKLPLVKQNLISFELIPLIPYAGFSRLFKSDN